MSYLRPTSARISDSWQGHRNRKPASQEPGTDYACAYGTTLVAPASGRIVAMKSSTGGATGRYLTIDLDDGRRVRWLHLSAILVKVGDRVSRGQAIARSGASAQGEEWGVGAHVHVSLFPTHSYGGFGPNSTVDFEKYIGGKPAALPSSGNNATPTTPVTQPEEEDMKVKFGHRTGEHTDEWMIVHPQFEDGYLVTTSKPDAIAWSRLHGIGWHRDENKRYDFNVPRSEYIDIQNAAKMAAKAWRIS